MSPLPRAARDLLAEWELEVDGDAVTGRHALVVPVTTADRRAVLKIAGPDEGSRHEILGLHTWHGRGAVTLLRADPRRGAMLVERAHARDLTALPALEACEIVAGLYRRLHVPAPPQLVPLTRRVGEWTDALERLPRDAPVPRRVVQHAVHLGRAFSTDEASTGRLVHTDLHSRNVLAADREPWLAIAPRPLSGDPHFEVAPLLWHRWGEVVATRDVRSAVRARFHTAVDVAGLDEARARDWVIVRVVHRATRAIEAGDDGRLTAAIAIVKAVQD
ncbi:MAG: aminoglycoside phosphotransferase family protein [Aeromicrobium sp.]